MTTVEPLTGESLAAYLARCLTEARRSGQPLLARYDHVSIVVVPEMTAGSMADAWVTAKRSKFLSSTS